MNRSDWLMYVIAAAGPKGLSPVQLQKTMFLLGQEHPKDTGEDYYSFEPYDYGPFTSDVYSDAEVLAIEGLVLIDNPSARGSRRYSATKTGVERASTVSKNISSKASEFIEATIEWMRPLSFPDLVRTIYERYPSFRSRSVFKE
jgi:uncharacterized protein